MEEKQTPVALTEEELAQITGGAQNTHAVGGMGQMSQIDLSTMDLETALMMVQNQRAQALDSQLHSQIKMVEERNATIAQLNEDLGALDKVANLFPAGAKADDKISASTTVQIGGKEMSLGEALTSLNYAESSSLKIEEMLQDGHVSKAELDDSIQSLKGMIDSSSNLQQMDMLRLQSMTNKRNEAFDVMTSFVKKMQDSRSSIIGNMR